ncbi:ras-related protein Rab-40C isoform X2 [Eubalaena glacialis]|uniref:ras-related protein Rab-40C isoform X2 n=1 Tax=Eubalaena glacialis TaxID=27606 RepID=UPI002A5A5B02|nr:ras-related protein Rab-40C isoform X2 [Eubalaena glacialis]
MGTQGSPVKSYDYLLKFLLVGDSDVGKGEILESLQDGAAESPYAYSNGIDYKTTTILLDGRRVKLELWDTSGQGRFCTIFRSYSRGAQGILLVYDITNRWSFDGIDRWIKEIDEWGPVPQGAPPHHRSDRGPPPGGGSTERGRPAFVPLLSPVRYLARSRGPPDPGWEPAAPGLQAASPDRAGACLRGEELHDLLRGQPTVQLQCHRVLHRTVPHRPYAARHGEDLEAQPSVQSAGPLLPGHRFLHPRAPHRQAPASCHHQEPPQVLLDGQWHERCYDARALLLTG